ncbi:MAG: portal protein, partial [Tepidiformaceae bacterium]
MTDTIVPPEVELASESDITPQSDARGTPLGELDELAARARAWFIAADEHPLWVEYRREAKEDMGFYIGGKYQWSINGSLEEYERLVAKRRTVVSINHCQSIVDVMAGFERQNRMDIKASPQGDEDAEGAQLMTWLLKFVQEQTSCQDHISELFEDGTICGMDCLEVGVDYSERPDKGQIFTARCTPGKDIIWDPCWLDYDLSDAINGARFVIKWKWAWVADVVARHQKYEREIHAA